MVGRTDAARVAQFTDLVDGIADVLATGRLTQDQRGRLLDVIDTVLGALSGQSAELSGELTALRLQIVAAGEQRRPRGADRKPCGALTQQLKRIGLHLTARTSKWDAPK